MSSIDKTSQAEALFDGKFRIEEMLGSGAGGCVFRATLEGLDRRLALKIVHDSGYIADHEAAQRFLQEAQTLSQLDSPYVPKFYSFGIDKGGSAYFAYELLEGQTLDKIILESKRLTFEDTLKIATGLCLALAVIHPRGIIHRDLKPSNIFVRSTGDIVLLDFGLARQARNDAQRLTQPGFVVGTTTYMSPQQVQGKPCDARSDIYSYGCVLFHCLTGSPPFVGLDDFSIGHQHVYAEPPALKEARPDLPNWFEALVLKCLTKDPEDRFQTATEILKVIAKNDEAESQTRADDQTSKSAHKWTKGKSGAHSLWTVLAVVGIVGILAMVTWNLSRHPTEINNSLSTDPGGQLLEPLDAAIARGNTRSAVALLKMLGTTNYETPKTKIHRTLSLATLKLLQDQSATTPLLVQSKLENEMRGKFDRELSDELRSHTTRLLALGQGNLAHGRSSLAARCFVLALRDAYLLGNIAQLRSVMYALGQCNDTGDSGLQSLLEFYLSHVIAAYGSDNILCADTWYVRARLWQNTGQWDRAKWAFSEYLKFQPAIILPTDRKQAAEQFIRQLKQEPKNFPGYIKRQAYLETLRCAWNSAKSRSIDQKPAWLLAGELTADANFDEAEALYKSILVSLRPGDNSSRFHCLTALGDISIAKGKWNEASRFLNQAIDNVDFSQKQPAILAFTALALSSEHQHNLDLTRKCHQKLLELRSNDNNDMFLRRCIDEDRTRQSLEKVNEKND